MSEGDLRPPSSGTPYRPPPGPVRAPGPPWWEPLTSKIGLLLFVIFAGLALGAYEYVAGKVPMSDATERNRPKLEAAMRPAIDAFYDNPTVDEMRRLEKVITNYRKSFPDALPVTLQAPSEKIDCRGSTTECNMAHRKKNEEYSHILSDALPKLAGMRRGTPEYQARLVELYALDRRLSIRIALDTIADDQRELLPEKEAAKELVTLFQFIDTVVAADRAGPIFRDGRLRIGYEALEQHAAKLMTVRRSFPQRRCFGGQPGHEVRVEGQYLCGQPQMDFEKQLEGVNRTTTDLTARRREKAEIFKKAVSARALPVSYLKVQFDLIFVRSRY